MIRRRDLILSSAAASLAMPGLSHAQSSSYKKEYRLSMVSPPGPLWYKMADLFANTVRERTSGRIAIKLYPGSSLVQGQQDRELVALRQGAIDIIVGTGVNYSGTVKDMAAFALPFLMTNSKEVDAVLASKARTEDYYGIVRSKAGMEILASAEYGYIQLFNSKRRLTKASDMTGLKVRVVGSPMFQDVMNALGANPTSMPWAEAQAALASDAVDGVTLTQEQAIAAKAVTLGQKYVTKWNAFTELLHISIANPIWASWSPEDQKIVRAAAQDTAKEITRLTRANEQADEEALRRAGVDVYIPTPAELDEWRILVRRPYAKWKATINPQLVGKLEEVIAQASKKV